MSEFRISDVQCICIIILLCASTASSQYTDSGQFANHDWYWYSREEKAKEKISTYGLLISGQRFFLLEEMKLAWINGAREFWWPARARGIINKKWKVIVSNPTWTEDVKYFIRLSRCSTFPFHSLFYFQSSLNLVISNLLFQFY